MQVRRWVATAFSAGLLILCGSIAVLAVSGWRLVPVLSGSMRPMLQPGDLVAARPEAAGTLMIGQVVVYNAPVDDHPVILHRVIEVRRNGNDVLFRTRGDANNTPDAWTAALPADHPILVFRGDLPHLGRPGHALASSGKALPIGAVAGLTVLLLFLVWRPRRQEERTSPTVDRDDSELVSTR